MEFDPRMTEETKQIVTFTNALFKQIFSAGSLQAGRGIFDSIDDDLIKTYTNDNIEEKEYFIENPNDHYMVPVTAYIPKNVTKDSTIVVFIHGGGWMYFTRKTYKRSVSYMAEHTNMIWVSIEYRLSPEYKHPTAIQDCCSVLEWVKNNKCQIFNSTENAKIGICGDSAGGHLTACVAQRLRNLLSFQILIYPWLDLTCSADSYQQYGSEKYTLTRDAIENALQIYIENAEDRKLPTASPLLNDDLSGLPKCLFISAEMDPLVGDAYAYQKKLQDNGLDSEMYVVKGSVHGFFHSYLNYKNAFLEATDKILKFLKEF